MAGWCASLSKPEKGFWFIVVLAAIAVLIYEWVLVVTDFVHHPYRSHVIFEDKDFLELPSILLCPRDPINYTIANKQVVVPNQGSSALSVATLRYIQQMTYPSGISPQVAPALTQPEIDIANQQWPAFYQQPQYYSDKWRAYIDLHWQCEGMVKRCQVGDGYNMTNTECCRMAMPLTTPEGPCVQFQLPFQYIPSYLGGFHMDLEIKNADMQSPAAGFQGIDVFIGSSVEKPMYPSLRLQREQVYNVKVKPQSYHKGDTRKCDMHMSEYYGQEMPYINATMNCTAKIVWNRCSCYPFFKLQTDNRDQAQVCNWQQVKDCANETLKLMHEKRNVTAYYNQNYNHICGQTYPPCDWMKYDTVIDQIKDPEASNFNAFTSKVTFFFDDFEVMLIEQYWAPNFHDVIIQMGGALVFWFVVVHLLMYIVEGFKMLCITAGWKPKNKIDDAEMMGPPMKGHPPPIVTHHITTDIPPPPRHHLEPLPPIPVIEANQETQTAPAH